MKTGTKTTKKSAKKSTKKSTKSTKSTVKKAANSKLLAELTKIAKKLPDEGVSILIKQAEVILHNLQVEEEYAKNQIEREKLAKKLNKNRAIIEIVESNDNSFFSVTINGENKTFLLDEMKTLVKICHTSTNKEEASRKMYRWFETKRKDVLNDVYIDTPYHFLLHALYETLVNRYTVQ